MRRRPALLFTITITVAPSVMSGMTPVHAVADDGMPSHPSWHECRTDNNQSDPQTLACSVPK